MAEYHLWISWSPLDENLQWLRQVTPKPYTKHPFRITQRSPYKTSVDLHWCFQTIPQIIDQILYEDYEDTNIENPWNNKDSIVIPQPVKITALDVVFGKTITIQPPKWSGSFHISKNSSFSRVISHKFLWPSGLKEQEIKMTVKMCKQLLRSILLLYATYKKCSFVLQQSKQNP
ncbi:FANCD2 opposite strand protein [Rhinophrynus dorsalis]